MESGRVPVVVLALLWAGSMIVGQIIPTRWMVLSPSPAAVIALKVPDSTVISRLQGAKELIVPGWAVCGAVRRLRLYNASQRPSRWVSPEVCNAPSSRAADPNSAVAAK